MNPNYVNWKFKLQTVMEGYYAWSIAWGDEVKPNVIVGATISSIEYWEARD